MTAKYETGTTLPPLVLEDGVPYLAMHSGRTTVNGFELRSASLEETLSAYPYGGEHQTKVSASEYSKLPPFAAAFWQYVVERGGLPTDQRLWEWYRARHEGEITALAASARRDADEFIEGVRGRFERTYASLIRDIHFHCLAAESPAVSQATYSLLDDVRSGVDARIVVSGRHVSVALLLASERGMQFFLEKAARHPCEPRADVVLLCGPGHLTAGEYKLFSPKHLALCTRWARLPGGGRPSDAQLDLIRTMGAERGLSLDAPTTQDEARWLIDWLKTWPSWLSAGDVDWVWR